MYWVCVISVPATTRVHTHLYITTLKLRCTRCCRKTRLWRHVFEEARESVWEKRQNSYVALANTLAFVCYECVKKIVARATHGEEIDMKAPFSRNKTMTPPPPCQTPVNTIKGRGGWDLVIVNTPTSMRAINELRLLHLTGHYTCPFWDSITHFELWTLTKQVMEPGPILSCEKKDPFKWTNIPQVSSLQWQHHWGGMWQGN